jgi:hypothetical protein
MFEYFGLYMIIGFSTMLYVLGRQHERGENSWVVFLITIGCGLVWPVWILSALYTINKKTT